MRMLWPLVSLLGFSVMLFGGACSEEDDPDSPGASASGPGSGAASVGGQGAGGEGGGQGGDGGGPVEPPELPFEWVGVIGTGQSLSVGAASQPMSTTQPFGNLKLVDNGPDPKYPIAPDTGAPQWEAVPLVEPIRQYVAGSGPGYGDGQYPNSVGGETPHSGMANTLSMLWQQRGGEGEYVTAHSVVGWSGHCLAESTRWRPARLPGQPHEAMVFQDLATAPARPSATAASSSPGECDGGNAGYGAGLSSSGRTTTPTSRRHRAAGRRGAVRLAAEHRRCQQRRQLGGAGLARGRRSPGQIVCVGPKYQYQYAGDLIHVEAPGYQRLGQKYAEVFDAVVNQKLPWKPLQPKEVTRAGKTLTIELDVPNPPLVWDTHISAPHTQVNTAWASGRGFEVSDGNGAPLAIADAVIEGSSVVLTLADTPPAGALRVAYAITQDGDGLQGGTDQGMRGQLRDSDDFVGHDAEQLEARSPPARR